MPINKHSITMKTPIGTDKLYDFARYKYIGIAVAPIRS